MKMKSESEVAQLCPTFSDPMDCSLSGSSVHGIFQARVLEWGAIAFSKMMCKCMYIYMCVYVYVCVYICLYIYWALKFYLLHLLCIRVTLLG